MEDSKSKIQDEINNMPLVDDDPLLVVKDENDSSTEFDGSHSNNSVDSIPSMFANDNGSPSHNRSNVDISPDELEEKARLITQVLELQNTLDDTNVNNDGGVLVSSSQLIPQECLELCDEDGSHQSTVIRLTIVDGRFFKIVHDKCTSTKIVATCMLCPDTSNTEIAGISSSSSNFLNHLKRKHGEQAVTAYQQYVAEKKAKTDSGPAPPPVKRRRIISQKTFESDLLKYVVHAMVPLRSVDDVFFRKIFEDLDIAAVGLKLVSRRTLTRSLQSLFARSRACIAEQLERMEQACATAYVWTARRRSVFVETLHYVDENLERVSVAVACRKFASPLAARGIAALMDTVHAEYRVPASKIVATLSHDGSTVVRAFRVFGVRSENVVCEPGDDAVVDDAFSDEEGSGNDDAPSEGADLDLRPFLANHLQCAAHTLSLCASADLMKGLNRFPATKKLHKEVLAKCNVLWKATSSAKYSHLLEELLGYALPRPVAPWWNSVYEALDKISEMKHRSHEAFELIRQQKCALSTQEILYVREHLRITKPLADAIDILQGEEYTFYGILLPTLLSLRRKLERLCQTEFVHCGGLAEVLLQSVNTRFDELFSFQSANSLAAAFAAFSHPQFKHRWLNCVSRTQQSVIKMAFTEAVQREIPVNSEPEVPATTSMMEDFFDFGQDDVSAEYSEQTKAELEVLLYLRDPSEDLCMLHKYEAVKRVFIRYNTPLPSSAVVERLFSFATMTNLPKSTWLTDVNFESRILLKSNMKYWDNYINFAIE